MIEALGMFGVLVVGFLSLLCFVLWICLPFLIIGANRRLDKIHYELQLLRQQTSPPPPAQLADPEFLRAQYGLAPTPLAPPPPVPSSPLPVFPSS